MAQDDQPDHLVENWLKTLGIESLCQWDVLVFLYRHQASLVSAEYIARFLGYATAEVVAALDSLESSRLVERSRVSQGVRLYQLTAPADPALNDALERLMTFGYSRIARLLLARRLRGRDHLNQSPPRSQTEFGNEGDLRSPGVKDSET
jgi:DNA-binding MarR family transcriptional regulator